jgi:hypothetical protein
MQQSTIITLAQRLISNYNDLLAATVNMPEHDRVYYAKRIQEGIERAEEMIERESVNVGDDSLLHY